MHQPRISLLRAAVLCAVATTCAHANDGLDTSWNGTGTLVQPVSGYNVSTAALVVQPDGRILLGSGCTASSMPTICMARLQPNGLRDYSFGPSETGTFTFTEFPSWPTSRLVRGLARQGDGRLRCDVRSRRQAARRVLVDARQQRSQCRRFRRERHRSLGLWIQH